MQNEGAQNNRNLHMFEVKHLPKLLNSINSAHTALQLDLKILWNFHYTASDCVL